MRLRRAVEAKETHDRVLTRAEGGVSASEVRRFFRDTPGIATTERSLGNLLDEASAFYRVIALQSFRGMSIWTLPVIPGAARPVKLLLLGESHNNPHSGDRLMRYIMGQVVLEGKCVDMYLESGFDWQGVVQSGGSALTHIRRTYPVVPGLRVHHVDVRSVVPNSVTHAFNDPTISDYPHQWRHVPDIQRPLIKLLGATMYNRNPYDVRYFPGDDREVSDFLGTNDLFRINAREYFAMATGFAGILRSRLCRGGDRTIAQLTAQYRADRAAARAGAGAAGVSSVLAERLNKIHPVSVFVNVRQRFAKQRRRFLRTTQMDEATLDVRIGQWALRMTDMRDSIPATMDLFAFYRMFGTFNARAGGRANKAGCPMEQRNIVYVAGDFHARQSLLALLLYVFHILPDVTRGTHSTTAHPADPRAHVESTPPLDVF